MAFLAAGGQMSAYCRTKTCQDAGRVLADIRSLGLARPGGPAAGLADGFTLIGGDVPAKADPGEPGRDVPAEIMRQLCANLPQLEEVISSRETRVAVELLIDTGRRPAEICTLEWDCWPAAPTAPRCWSMTMPMPTGCAAACRSASTPPR